MVQVEGLFEHSVSFDQVFVLAKTYPGCECSVLFVVNDLKQSKQRATFVVGEKMDMETPIDFSEWYAAEYSRLVVVLALSTGSREVGEDAAAEAFARAYEKWDRVRRMATPTGWTYTVGLNVARRKMRRAALERALLRRQKPVEFTTSPPDLSGLRKAVEDLPDRQRRAVLLRYYADLPESEIAKVMKVSPGTIAKTLHVARKRLEARLASIEPTVGLEASTGDNHQEIK
jgi:RNA polymerase sigma-70 factor (ECF subfamily)